MLICQDYKVAFMAIPKTGTRTIYAVLKEHYGGEVHGDHRVNIQIPYRNFFTNLRKNAVWL